VNRPSLFGLNGYIGWNLYGATKHAVTGLTKAGADRGDANGSVTDEQEGTDQ